MTRLFLWIVLPKGIRREGDAHPLCTGQWEHVREECNSGTALPEDAVYTEQIGEMYARHCTGCSSGHPQRLPYLRTACNGWTFRWETSPAVHSTRNCRIEQYNRIQTTSTHLRQKPVSNWVTAHWVLIGESLYRKPFWVQRTWNIRCWRKWNLIFTLTTSYFDKKRPQVLLGIKRRN